jgi:ferredoxin-NADP reductase
MPRLDIVGREDAGENTVAITVESPPDFEAYPGQFVLVRATIDGEEETGYYTISSPEIGDSFEMTVEYHPDGTLGPWLEERSVGEELTVEGPFGDVTYRGEDDAVVIAGGPGIGPAVGIAERARDADRDATIVFGGQNPAHADRLADLEAAGATMIRTDDLGDAIESLDLSAGTIYVFGFQGFVEETKAALTAAGVDLDAVEIESFGPE